MSNVKQLLAKALSTTSEEEAMACLRMARKKGGRLEDSSASSEYNGHGAEYWYNKAVMYYNRAKEAIENRDGLSKVQQQQVWNMYKNESAVASRLREEKELLQKEIHALKLRPPAGTWKIPVIIAQAGVILILLQLIG